MFSVAHKTVFVVDHCPYMAESSRQQVECDVLTKSRGQGVIPLAPVSKSLWTCAVECSMEYCRILYDIYPLDKLVSEPSRFVSARGGQMLSSKNLYFFPD